MKAILIDVKNQQVKEVEYKETIQHIYDLVNCTTFDVVNIDNHNSIYVDDEGLFVEDQLYFTFTGTHKSITLAGNGLILGVEHNSGETIEPSITLQEVQDAVSFEPEGYSTTPFFSITQWQ
jgi:hypothetical protein